jgi:hypothetical protein
MVVAVVESSASSPPQPWIAKKALNAKSDIQNARPVIV